MVAYAAFVPNEGVATTGPLAVLAPLATSTGSWEIRVVDLSNASDTPASLGQGSDPRFLSNGDILAYADEGVVRIDPKDGSRTVVVPARSAFLVGLYAVADDLSHIAVSDADTGVDVYALAPDGTASPAGSITGALAPIGFSSNGELAAIRANTADAELWSLSSTPKLDRSFSLPSASSTPAL
jgi:hypothetical protein